MPQTGATTYQKFKKSEKSKTKLKAKKKDLPKGTNVTKTDFKVKKIIIRKQLKEHDENEALSKKKLNVKELLSRLNHFNTNARLEALNGLKEILISHPNVLDHNLGQLFSGVTPLVMSVEKTVRQETLKVLHLILSNTTKENIFPFYSILSTYLRSSMTHIDTRIKEDSLQLFDILLTCCPEKVVLEFNKILPTVMTLLSPMTVIKSNMNTNVDIIKWTVKVMQSVREFFNQYVQHNNLNDKKKDDDVKYIFNPSNNNSYPLFNPTATSICQVSCVSSKMLNQDLTVPPDKGSILESAAFSLMSSLSFLWLELCPGASINEHNAAVLKDTVNTISTLISLIHTSSFYEDFCRYKRNEFINSFVNPFPFVMTERMGQRRDGNVQSEAPGDRDPKLTAENLEICHIYIKLSDFAFRTGGDSADKAAVAVLDYIEISLSITSSDRIINLVDSIIGGTLLYKVVWNEKNILVIFFEKLITKYVKTTCRSLKQRLFPLICHLHSLDYRINTTHSFRKWLQELPDTLLQESISKTAVDSLHVFAAENKKIFNSLIKSKLIEIVQNLPLIKVLDDHDSVYYYKLFSLFYWVKYWNDESLNLLEEQLTNCAYSNDHSKYIFTTLQLRAGGILQEFCQVE